VGEMRLTYHRDEIIGPCSECGAPCTDNDLVGNQTELGFPVLWCGLCINRHLDEDWRAAHELPQSEPDTD
jgi:hypothetical protein